MNETIRKVYVNKDEQDENLLDIMWFLWISPDSPFFGKNKMATFESYFIKDKEAHKEEKILIIICRIKRKSVIRF